MKLKPITIICVLLAIIIVFLCSCGNNTSTITSDVPVPSVLQTVTWAQIHWFLTQDEKLNFSKYNYPDSFYTIVDEQYFTNNILNKYKLFLKSQGLEIGATNKNDCDKFARGLTFFTHIQAYHCPILTNTIPIADYYYELNFTKGHAINIIVVLDNKTLAKKLLYIEPQTQSIINSNSYVDFKNPFFQIDYIGF